MAKLTQEILTEQQKADYNEVAASIQKLPNVVKDRLYFMIMGAELVGTPNSSEPDKPKAS